MTILSLIKADSNIIFNRALARILGIDKTIFLYELLHQQEYFEQRQELFEIEGLGEGFFYSSNEYMQERTLFDLKKQYRLREQMKERGFITVYVCKKQARVYYRTETKVIEKFLKDLNLTEKKPQKNKIKQIFIPKQKTDGLSQNCLPNDIKNDKTFDLRQKIDIEKEASISSSTDEKKVFDPDTFVYADGSKPSFTDKQYLRKILKENWPRLKRSLESYYAYLKKAIPIKTTHAKFLQWLMSKNAPSPKEVKENREYAATMIDAWKILKAKISNASVVFATDTVPFTLSREAFRAQFNSLAQLPC